MNSDPEYILITRPQQAAKDLAGIVKSKGFSTVIDPMLSIEPMDITLPDLSRFSGLIFTSANAVRIVSGLTNERNMPVYTVGKDTEEGAYFHDWRCIKSGSGGNDDLLKLLEQEKLSGQILLHLSGQHISGQLIADGVNIERLVVYEAVKAEKLSDQCLSFLDNGKFAAIMFFSVRTAETFVELLVKHERTNLVSSIKALCISDSVLECVRHVPWKDVQVSNMANRSGMLSLLDNINI